MSPFQPTLPARGATRPVPVCGRRRSISTHAPRTGSDHQACSQRGRAQRISTHAPRTGSDDGDELDMERCDTISTHAPRTGSDTAQHPDSPRGGHFNPRSPHGERHAMAWAIQRVNAFQPTLPARGATNAPKFGKHRQLISTHAPRTGSDGRRVQRLPFRQNFNPRSPHGERPHKPGGGAATTRFQPTLPARGATLARQTTDEQPAISTHAPRTGSDTSPGTADDHDKQPFQPTLPARGATEAGGIANMRRDHFNPRSPHGERPTSAPFSGKRSEFQPTLPARGATNSSFLL